MGYKPNEFCGCCGAPMSLPRYLKAHEGEAEAMVHALAVIMVLCEGEEGKVFDEIYAAADLGLRGKLFEDEKEKADV